MEIPYVNDSLTHLGSGQLAPQLPDRLVLLRVSPRGRSVSPRYSLLQWGCHSYYLSECIYLEAFGVEIVSGFELAGLRVSRSSGVYICKSIVNDLRHVNYIRDSEVIYLCVSVDCGAGPRPVTASRPARTPPLQARKHVEDHAAGTRDAAKRTQRENRGNGNGVL